MMFELESVSKEFSLRGKRKKTALRDISFSLCEGETIALVGESGCGKSTIGKLMLGLEKPTEGRIRFEKENLSDYLKKDRRKFYHRVQPIIQDPYLALSPRMKIEKFLSEPLVYLNGLSRREAFEQLDELLLSVRLTPDYKERYAHQLSGGELQRVIIARAISSHPRFLICDEPTSALDVSTQKEILDLLLEMREREKLSWLFITHDLSVAHRMCDAFLVIYNGVIVEKLHREEFHKIRHPYTKRLFSSFITLKTTRESLEPVLEEANEVKKSLWDKGCVYSEKCPECSGRCRLERPPLRQIAPNHQVACWKYVPTDSMPDEERTHMEDKRGLRGKEQHAGDKESDGSIQK